MKNKYFNISIILRLLIIILLAAGATYLFFVKEVYILGAFFAFFMVLAVINIIRYFNKVNQWIAFFLLGIENEDSSLNIPSKTGNKAIDEVMMGINRLQDIFHQTKMEITTQEQYFKSIINQSATGLFSVNEKGRIINLNPAAEKLCNIREYFHVNFLHYIDEALPNYILQKETKQYSQSAIFENKHGQKLLFKISEIITTKERIKLIAVSDITKELDNREVEAWIKLARTLSHEIMNNITPITTLSQVIMDYFVVDNKLIQKEEINQEKIQNTVKALQVIEERSSGLMQFVQNYRKFTKLPEPQIQSVDLSELVEKMLITMAAFEGFEKLSVHKVLPHEFPFNTDGSLLSQVILNILKNALESLIQSQVDKPVIRIKLTQINQSARLEISNNGPPIPAELKGQIFVPFFTTKEGGSGIGLSLSKQILLQMNGDILLQSDSDLWTSFVVLLKE